MLPCVFGRVINAGAPPVMIFLPYELVAYRHAFTRCGNIRGSERKFSVVSQTNCRIMGIRRIPSDELMIQYERCERSAPRARKRMSRWGNHNDEFSAFEAYTDKISTHVRFFLSITINGNLHL